MTRGTPESLRGRSALVTGASRGIGRAVAELFAEAGATVHLMARSRDALQEVAGITGGHGWPADVTDEAEVWDALDRLQEGIGGPPDVVVNAAGVFDVAPLTDTSVAVFDRNVQVNLRGTFLVIRALLPGMLERGSGTMIQVGSVAGRKAFPGNGAYTASKYGLRGLHEVLLEEIRGTGVRATLLEPAATDTSIWDPMDPDGRDDLPSRDAMLRPEEVARAALYAASRPRGGQVPLLAVEAG